jgi:hypothetical protein
MKTFLFHFQDNLHKSGGELQKPTDEIQQLTNLKTENSDPYHLL